MIDPKKAFTLSEAARRVPGVYGGTAHPATTGRWASEGLLTPSGKRVKLRTYRFGRHVYTTQEYLDEFLAAFNPPQEPEPKPEPVPSLELAGV